MDAAKTPSRGEDGMKPELQEKTLIFESINYQLPVDVSDKTIETAKELYEEQCRQQTAHGRDWYGTALGAMYLACRNHNQPIIAQDMTLPIPEAVKNPRPNHSEGLQRLKAPYTDYEEHPDAAKLIRKQAKKIYRNTSKNLDYTPAPMDAFIIRYLNAVGAEQPQINKASYVAETIKTCDHMQTRSPHTISAAVVLLGFKLDHKRISASRIAKHVPVVSHTANTIKREIVKNHPEIVERYRAGDYV